MGPRRRERILPLSVFVSSLALSASVPPSSWSWRNSASFQLEVRVRLGSQRRCRTSVLVSSMSQSGSRDSIARQGILSIPSIAPGGTHAATFTLLPALTKGFFSLEEGWAKWRDRYSTNGIRILPGTSNLGKGYVQWHQPPVAGRAGLIQCGVVSNDDPFFGDVRECMTERLISRMANVSDGTFGVHLKGVGGPVFAERNSTMGFEPASTIKVIIHYHAIRRTESNPPFTPNVVIPWFTAYGPKADGTDSSCPLDAGMTTEKVRDALKGMMQDSDNRQTQALRVLLGEGNINATAHSIRMTNTLYQHRDGCGDDAISHPNRLTLAEAGMLYEGVANGTLLKPPSKATFNEDTHSKLARVVADLFGVSGRQMLAACIAGERDPQALATLARGRLRQKLPALERALAGP